jgi:tRNA dimethylallyltransferase
MLWRGGQQVRSFVRTMSVKPFLAVLGTTGAGKTKLSVELCKRFKGEVVNADSMQVYRELAIATAKVTPEEAGGVPHHLLSFLDPWDAYTVRAFRDRAEAVMDDIRARGGLPVIVGGTGYYVQSLLRDSLLADDGDPGRGPSVVRKRPREDSFVELARCDPVMARRLHPLDSRRVARALEVFHETGRPQSELVLEQAARATASSDLAVACVLWVSARQPELDERLDRRVDEMLRQGLLLELESLWDAAEAAGRDPVTGRTRTGSSTAVAATAASSSLTPDSHPSDDTPVGAFVAIGYKEFVPYLEALRRQGKRVRDHALAGATADGAANESLDGTLRTGVDQLKLHTRQYARDQLVWIRRRFLDRGVHMIELDSTDADRWSEAVFEPARKAVEAFLAACKGGGAALEQYRVPSDAQSAEVLMSWRKFRCRACDLILDGETSWTGHLCSARHKSGVRKWVSRARQVVAMAESIPPDEFRVKMDSVPAFRAMGSVERARQVLEAMSEADARNVWDLPWPADDGVAAGSAACDDMVALARLSAKTGESSD